MNHTIRHLEAEIKHLQNVKARYVHNIQASQHDSDRAYWTVQSMAAGAVLAKLTDSLETLRRMQDDDATNSQE
uniref:Uncharacterized protein n=1 Tax=viral metagenome TaxID=1070528 RepID=A0A6M3LGQ6_9ZZZZ